MLTTNNDFGFRYVDRNNIIVKIRCDAQKKINSHRRKENKVQVKTSKNSRRINRKYTNRRNK